MRLAEAKIGPLIGDFHFTSIGYKIQRACKEQFGAQDVLGLVSEGLKRGLSCLMRIGTPQSKANAHKMVALMSDERNPPKIICDKLSFNGYRHEWRPSVIAYSTVPGGKDHPFIWFNPSNIRERQVEEQSASVFHETMHNIGYRHEVDIDYPYACTSCCFIGSTKKTRSLACRICAGRYEGPQDKRYVTDITNFFLQDERDHWNMGVLLRYLRMYPDDRWARFKLVTANLSHSLSPLAVAFARSLKKKYSPLSTEERSEIAAAERLGTTNYVKLFSEATGLVSESLFKLLDGDFSGAETELAKVRIPGREIDPSVEEFDYEYMKEMIENLIRARQAIN